jgi:hypothetical protein
MPTSSTGGMELSGAYPLRDPHYCEDNQNDEARSMNRRPARLHGFWWGRLWRSISPLALRNGDAMPATGR